MAKSGQIVVAFLTLSSESFTDQFIRRIANSKPQPTCFPLNLTNQDLQSFTPQREFDAVVLLHSISQGRNSITDVADAKYSKLLPDLKEIYGPDRVAVVVHSMTSINSNTKEALMMVFENSQPTTFQCSKCVIQCNNLAEMPGEDLSRLTEFLEKVPDHPLPIPEDEVHSILTTTPSADRIATVSDSVTGGEQSMASSTLSSTEGSQASSKVDISPKGYATKDKVINTTYPIALVSLPSAHQPEQLRDDLQRQFPGKTIMLIEDIQQLKGSWYLFEAILVDLGVGSDECKGALHIYQTCLEKIMVRQNNALLMLAPANTTDHERASDIIRMISEIAKTTEVSVFQYSSESCRPSLFDDDTKNRLASWLLDCNKRYQAAASQEGPGFFRRIQIQTFKIFTYFNKKLGR